MRLLRSWHCFVGSGIVAVAAIMSSGCQTVNSELAMLFGEAPPAHVNEQPAAGDNSPQFYVELRADGRSPKLMQFPATDGMLVQQALEQSGAVKKFRRMKLELYRKLPSGGGHKMDIHFDHTKDRVPPGEDYAIHPGDRLVATEDTSTVLDDMLGSLGESFGKTSKR